jgi:hypothetical protein
MHVSAVLQASLVQRAVASVLLNALSRLRSIYPRGREPLSTSCDRRSRSPRLLAGVDSMHSVLSHFAGNPKLILEMFRLGLCQFLRFDT